MSNFLAIATVTAALERLLQSAVGVDVPGSDVTTDRPESTIPANPTVNVFLYQVMPNPSLRNSDLPTRSSNGQVVVQRPRAALDLHYLLSFYGADDELEPQRLLGSTVRTLHSQALITDQMIQAVRSDATASPAVHPSLSTTNLDVEVEPVRLVPLPLNLDELSKLWSVFFQTPYVLSIAYQASVVLIEQDVVPAPALLVLDRDISVTARRPMIRHVRSQEGADQPIVSDTIIELVGDDLAGDVTLVRLAGADRSPEVATANRVRLDLATVAAGHLRAGTQNVQVIHQTLLGIPPTPHAGQESNFASFVLQPRVVSTSTTGTGASGTVSIQVDMTVRAGQHTMLALIDPATEARVRVVQGTPLTADGTNLQFPISSVPSGSYLVQVHVDHAHSPFEVDVGGNVIGPLVTLT